MPWRSGKWYPQFAELQQLHFEKNKDNKGDIEISCKTVDGRNPAPSGMYKTLQILGYLPYQLVQVIFHQQYGFSKPKGPQYFQTFVVQECA